MSRMTMATVILSLFIAAPVLAGDATNADLRNASFTPRQMAHCMMKHLRTHNPESYRDAYKACKEKFDELAQADRSETAMNEAAGDRHE